MWEADPALQGGHLALEHPFWAGSKLEGQTPETVPGEGDTRVTLRSVLLG